MRWTCSLIVLAGCRQIFGIMDPTRGSMDDASSDSTIVKIDASPVPDASMAGPIVHFAFETLDNHTIVDSSGHNHDGTCAGVTCPILAMGKFGHGVSFGSSGGNPNNFTVPPSSEFKFGQGFTAAFWIDLSALPTNQGCPLTEEGVFQICVDGTGAVTYLTTGFVGVTLTSSTHLAVGMYEHVAVTFDGTRANIYIKGTADQSTNEPMPALGNNDLVFGTDLDTGSTLPAALDEFQLWTRALTPTEIAALAIP